MKNNLKNDELSNISLGQINDYSQSETQKQSLKTTVENNASKENKVVSVATYTLLPFYLILSFLKYVIILLIAISVIMLVVQLLTGIPILTLARFIIIQLF